VRGNRWRETGPEKRESESSGSWTANPAAHTEPPEANPGDAAWVHEPRNERLTRLPEPSEAARSDRLAPDRGAGPAMQPVSRGRINGEEAQQKKPKEKALRSEA
jgi:hypothetical protein